MFAIIVRLQQLSYDLGLSGSQGTFLRFFIPHRAFI
jgi:hypothetical protein